MLNDHHIVTVYVTISIAVHPRRKPPPAWAILGHGELRSLGPPIILLPSRGPGAMLSPGENEHGTILR